MYTWMGAACGVSCALGVSESMLYADSKVASVPLTDCVGLDGQVDEDGSAIAGLTLRAKSMMVGAGFDVAVEGNAGLTSDFLEELAMESARSGVVVDEGMGAAADGTCP